MGWFVNHMVDIYSLSYMVCQPQYKCILHSYLYNFKSKIIKLTKKLKQRERVY